MGNILDTSSAKKIELLHEKATKSAADAISYAKEAGKLLLAIKDAIPHGSFGSWIQDNLTVSHRQAQRYISAYKGKAMRPKSLSKYDTMSDSDNEYFHERLKNPQWIPEADTWYSAGLENGGFWIVPDSRFTNAFHISVFTAPLGVDTSRTDIEWDTILSCTKHSVGANLVECSLVFYGLKNPKNVDWHTHKAPGQSVPFGKFEDDSNSSVLTKGNNDA